MNWNDLCRDGHQPAAVLLDMDGTLIDSMGMWYDIDVEFCRRHGIEMPATLQQEIEGLSFYETALFFIRRFSLTNRAFPKVTDRGADPDDRVAPEVLMAEWTEMAEDYYEKKVHLKPFVREFLDKCKSRGIALGIATSNAGKLAQAALDANQVSDYFQAVLTSEEVPKGKPAPDIYQKLAQMLGAEPGSCVVFEDLIPGLIAAKAAGMRCVAVEDDYSAKDREEKREMADQYLDSFSDLL